MNEHRLEIQHETLFKIVLVKHTTIPPVAIEKHVRKEIDFLHTHENNNKSAVQKKDDYIHTEVTRTLKKLCHEPLTTQEIKDYTYFPDEDDIDDIDEIDEIDEILKSEEYKYYPYSLIMKERVTINKQGTEKRSVGYRLNKNIDFFVEDKFDLRIATRLLYNLYHVQPEYDLKAPMVRYLTHRKKSTTQIHELQNLKLLTDTFIQMNIYKLSILEKSYYLIHLLKFISLEANLNIEIQNSKSTYSLKNITINKILFDTNKFNIFCDGISISITEMSEIKLIESACENSLNSNILAVFEILDNYPVFVKEYFQSEIKNIEEINSIFFQSTN